MISLSILSMLAIAAVVPSNSVSLTQIMPSRIDGGMTSVGMNRSFGSILWPPTAKPLRIGGRSFDRGLGTRAPNVIAYRLDGRYERFQAWVGLDREVINKPEASVVFRVKGDGRLLFESDVMHANDPARFVDVSVEGVTELKLEAGDTGDGNASDHADWAAPVLVGIRAHPRFGDGKTAYRISGRQVELQLDAKGYPAKVKLPKSGIEYPVDGRSEIEGCAATNTQVEKAGEGVRFVRNLSCGGRMVETFDPSGEGVRWGVDIQTEGKARGGRVNTLFRWLDPRAARIWTAWGRGVKWSDPMLPWDFRSDWYEYGSFFNRSQGVSLPMFTVLDDRHDTGLTVVHDFEDRIIKMNMASDQDGTLQFCRYNLRMGEGKRWRFHVELLPHAGDVRAALGAVVARYPDFFDPPNPFAYKVGGNAGYSSSERDLGVKFHKMGFTYNWKASFDFPYMGMFLAPVGPDETWLSFGGDSEGTVDNSGAGRHPVSVKQMADYSARMKREGYYVLNYFNVTEFGTDIEWPAPPRKAAKDKDLWRDPNDFLHYAIPGSILRIPEPRFTWGKAVVVDCGDPSYKEFLLKQARRHVEDLPDSAGICIDRMDWLDWDNPNADDGLTWSEGPARSLLNSWQDLMSELGPMFHQANKVIFGNPMVRRPDVARQLDGFYDEHGDFGFNINTASFLALRKPASMWTRGEDSLKPDPDAFVQKNLYMGVFLTAPIPGNDHCLNPSPMAEKLFLDYGPMFNALRGRKWVLLPHVIEVNRPALANVFEVPSGYVVAIGLAGANSSATVKLRGLKLKGFKAEAIVPGEKDWKQISPRSSGNIFELDVPVKRHGAMVRLIRP